MGVKTGRLSEIGLSILLDNLARNNATGHLKLYKSNKIATIDLYKGNVVDCYFEDLRDEEAFIAMIVYRFEMYSFFKNDNTPSKTLLIGNVDPFFIKGYRIIDEINYLKKIYGCYIRKSNGYVPKNKFQTDVCSFIEAPVLFEDAIDKFISHISKFIKFINDLNQTEDIQWTIEEEKKHTFQKTKN